MLRDVLIFVGGYDPNNERDYEQVTSFKLNRFRFTDPTSAYTGMIMGGVINALDYDIIFVAWDDGGADLFENGRVVANAIQHINRIKAEAGVCSESVVIGQSMGGLCTKIGLSLLEDEGVDHRISKYVSWDTPHEGANVPVNLQAMSA